ncbi:membrane-bound lytic murein transglycosylase MltF [Marinihelvus fidelis]|nr:membrane-bound lytic murein transglycosylase MltF [Marinihelvus fidelis]
MNHAPAEGHRRSIEYLSPSESVTYGIRVVFAVLFAPLLYTRSLRVLPNPFKTRWAVLCLPVALVCVAGAFAWLKGEDAPAVSRVDEIRDRGALVMLTRSGASSYFTGAQGDTGPEYELAQQFAEHLGVDIEVRVADAFTDLEHLLEAGEGDLIAANLTRTPSRELKFRFGPAYADTHTQVVVRCGIRKPRKLADLAGLQGAVVAGTSYEEQLLAASAEQPELNWSSRNDAGMEDLLLAVDEGRIDYTLVDERIFLVNSQFYPNVREAFDLGPAEPLAWAFARDDDDSLVQQAELFMRHARADGVLAAIDERFFRPRQKLNQVGMLRFVERVRERLPPWLPLFQEVAEEHDLDWRLLAAMAYQESHWDPAAVSPTGVRGLMMLTLNTANQMGLSNREDPLQSIRGGAGYLVYLRDKLPERIAEPDRTYFALAAYNLGFGSLEDARVLTERLGGNPDRWADVEKHLPLLAKEPYHSTLRYGYARGHEAQQYVRNIGRFYDTLVWMDTRAHPLLASRMMAAP